MSRDVLYIISFTFPFNLVYHRSPLYQLTIRLPHPFRGVSRPSDVACPVKLDKLKLIELVIHVNLKKNKK